MLLQNVPRAVAHRLAAGVTNGGMGWVVRVMLDVTDLIFSVCFMCAQLSEPVSSMPHLQLWTR